MTVKKYATLLLSVLLIILPQTKIGASQASYSWYCAHRKDNLQPNCDSCFSFIEDYDAYYIDRNHGDDCDEKVIYLTFDAGYENGNVERILDVLHEQNVKAAFFVLGNLIRKNTDLVNRMFDEGHLVCNHTYSHKRMTGISRDDFDRELERLEDVCLQYTGKSLAKYYRPPEGRFDKQSLQFAYDKGYKTVFWSFAYADWDNDNQMSPEAAKRKILQNVHNGEIMLLHPTSQTNADILSDIICELKSQGYRFGTLDDL